MISNWLYFNAGIMRWSTYCGLQRIFHNRKWRRFWHLVTEAEDAMFNDPEKRYTSTWRYLVDLMREKTITDGQLWTYALVVMAWDKME